MPSPCLARDDVNHEMFSQCGLGEIENSTDYADYILFEFDGRVWRESNELYESISC